MSKKNSMQCDSSLSIAQPFSRLIKGDGEILEEIVTKERHAQINKEATRSDGQQYQRNTIGAARKFR